MLDNYYGVWNIYDYRYYGIWNIHDYRYHTYLEAIAVYNTQLVYYKALSGRGGRGRFSRIHDCSTLDL